MSYRTPGVKATYRPWYETDTTKDYTIYAALESNSNTIFYKMENWAGQGREIKLKAEDANASGKQSLIDVLYHLKYSGPGTYHEGKSYSLPVVVEEMTEPEMNRVFRNPVY